MNIDIEKFLCELNENKHENAKANAFTEQINKLGEEIVGEK